MEVQEIGRTSVTVALRMPIREANLHPRSANVGGIGLAMLGMNFLPALNFLPAVQNRLGLCESTTTSQVQAMMDSEE